MEMTNTVTPGRKLLSHNPTCNCDKCQSSQPNVLMQERKSKRKLSLPRKDVSERESTAVIIDEQTEKPKRKKVNDIETVALKSDCVIKRSPVIKISFKSPGGKGQVVEIPSKMHSQEINTNQNGDETIPLPDIGAIVCATPQDRARRVLKKARYDRMRFLTQKSTIKGNESIINNLSQEAKVVLKQLHKNESLHRQKNLRSSISPKNAKEFNNNNINAEDQDNSAEVLQRLKNSDPQTHSIKVTRCKTYKGFTICQGDIVWGKIQGFPWWPGQVKNLTCKTVDGGILQQEACVDWFESKTVSMLQAHTLEHFSKFFDKRLQYSFKIFMILFLPFLFRFEKKRKGVRYKRAIKLAHEAEKKLTPEVRGLITQFET